jgi:hypothetical protein
MNKNNTLHNDEYNLPDDDLIRLKRAAEEETVIHDNVAHHRRTNTTRNCTSETARCELYDYPLQQDAEYNTMPCLLC